jgi:hypothetical protein
VLLYGRNFTQTYSITSPDQVQIGVGRKFDELHLLHGTFFADVDGQEIAFIRLNYSDGTTVELPICYGAQVRDFQRHRTEEKELLSDPNSKIIWRGPGMRSLLSTQRLFKSRLINPIPEKTVTTMDFVSTRKLASYFFVAATVVDRDPSRPVTPPCPSGEPERHFDGAIVIRVLDDTTGRPIKGAQVQSGMDDVDGAQGTGAPLHTSTKGEAVVRYPAGRETNISVVVQMQGYHGKTAKWTQNFPDHAVFRLTPVPPENSSPSTVYGNLPVEPASDHVFTPEVVPPAQVVAETIRNKVGRDLNTVGASYDDLRVTIAVMRENATPFKVSYRGLRNFKWGDGATPAANGEFIMEYIGASQWQGKLGGMEFTVPVGQADNFTLPFINDPPVIGEWESVDFVTDIAGFNPDQPAWKGKFFFTGLTFLENGSTTLPSLTWTRDVVINREDKTASRYEIREIKGQSYLFFEWKSGDVTISGMKPHYYVLKKAAE